MNNFIQKYNSDISIDEALLSLPLFDNIYFRMQAINLSMVDDFLIDLENKLLTEYVEIERTPIESALFVSAISQLWIFGLYELLRTWRQRCREIINFIEIVNTLSEKDRSYNIKLKENEIKGNDINLSSVGSITWHTYEQALRDNKYIVLLRDSYDKGELLFRRIEALRIYLAKHEIPKQKGSLTPAPGYGRIDVSNGSIYWQVLLKDNQVDVVSRRDIAEDCRYLLKDKYNYLLSPNIQKEVEKLKDYMYGVKLVNITLNNGTKFKNVQIAWNKEVIFVPTYDEIPFDAKDIIDVSIGGLTE